VWIGERPDQNTIDHAEDSSIRPNPKSQRQDDGGGKRGRPPTRNLTGAQTSGTLASSSSGAYLFTTTVNLPTNGGTLYYQFGESAPSFTIPGFVTTPSPFLVWPNLDTGAKPAQIAVIGPLGITGLNPTSATAGGSALTLTVNGTGFVTGSTVQWNGTALSTFLSGTQLNALVPPTLIATAGSASVTVSNPGGSVSNAASFIIGAPTPNITGLIPATAAAGGPGFTITVIGSGFQAGAGVLWNGSTLATVFVSGNQLTASVSDSLIASQGTATITVVNPGGASSNSANFTIIPPGPSISTLSPNSTPAVGPAFTLTVNGSSFVAGSVGGPVERVAIIDDLSQRHSVERLRTS
jgi:hypothetical protein